MRITQVISGLGGGGAECVCTNLANMWAARGSDVTILTITQGSEPPAFAIDSRVHRQNVPRWPAGRAELSIDSVMPMLRGLQGAGGMGIVLEMPILVMLRQAILSTAPDVVVTHIDLTNIRVLAAMHE